MYKYTNAHFNVPDIEIGIVFIFYPQCIMGKCNIENHCFLEIFFQYFFFSLMTLRMENKCWKLDFGLATETIVSKIIEVSFVTKEVRRKKCFSVLIVYIMWGGGLV